MSADHGIIQKERGIDMTFQQLQYFLEVHKTGSFSQTAKNLDVSTSSISITIGNLEKELGYPLFIRTQKGLMLTANGRKVLDHATHICERYRQLGNIHEASYNTLHIATNDYPPAKAAVTRLVAENAHKRDTSITVSTVSPGAHQRIALFEIDIGIIGNFHSRNLPLQNLLNQKGLAHKVLDVAPIEIILGRNHRLFDADAIQADQLENEIFIDTANRSYSGSNYLRGILNIPRENVVAVQQVDIRYELLSRGVGYTLGRRPSNAICEQYGLRCIPLEGVYAETVCVTNPTRPLNDLGRKFLEMLDEEILNYKKSIV